MRRVLVRRLAERTLRHLRVAEGADRRVVELSVALVDDAQMRALNRRYRRLGRTTDVLAFGQGEPASLPADGPPGIAPPVVLGDVVLSVETAVRRAGRSAHRLHEELARYLIHGILHVLGWDHHAAADRRLMRRQERLVRKAVWNDDDYLRVSASRSPG